MKVLIDTNVFLSYMLAAERPNTVTAVVTACLSLDEIDLLVPPEQIAEFRSKAATKRTFRSRIPHKAIDEFVAHLRVLGERQPPQEESVAYSRDPKDDYLVAYAVINEADYLVTGDQDLLVLSQVGQLQIATPAQFMKTLQSQNLLP